VLYCKGGARSARAVRQLQSLGMERVWSLAGGIDRWSDEVDHSVPKY
jgi:adenylyltransferase/sulfurtransferase